jgi:hypothetical protein
MAVGSISAAELTFDDIDWYYVGDSRRVMPTCVLPAESGMGSLWLSSLDPVLNIDWLTQKEVFRISIVALDHQIISRPNLSR